MKNLHKKTLHRNTSIYLLHREVRNHALGRETCVKMILDAVAAKEKTMG